MTQSTETQSTETQSIEIQGMATQSAEIDRAEPVILPPPFPDHTQLPEEDGTFVKEFSGASPKHSTHRFASPSSRTPASRRTVCHRSRLWHLLARDGAARRRCGSTRLVLRGQRSAQSRRKDSSFLRAVARIYFSARCFGVCQRERQKRTRPNPPVASEPRRGQKTGGSSGSTSKSSRFRTTAFTLSKRANWKSTI